MNMVKNFHKGSTLIIAVWSLFLLSTFAVQLGMIVRQKVTLVHHLNNRDERYYIAQAGVKQAIAQLRMPDTVADADFLGERWSDNSTMFKQRSLGRGSFTVSYEYRDDEEARIFYGLSDEESRININKVDVKILKRLLRVTAGLSQFEAEELAYCIIDWRDKDSFFQHPQYGSEDSDYKGLKYPYESKDGDFQILDELLLVNKMNKEVFDKIKHFVTIYGDGKVNINTASKQVLLSLGVTEYMVGNILSFRKGADMLVGTGDDNLFFQATTIVPRLSQNFSIGPSDMAALSNLVSAGLFTTQSEHFMIQSTSQLASAKGSTKIMAISDRMGKIYYWHEENN